MQTDGFKVEIERENGVVITRVKGPLDLTTVNRFQSAVSETWAMPGCRVLLDCAHLTYMNSRSIKLLLNYSNSIRLTRGRMVLCNVDTRWLRTLELLGVGDALQFCSTREEAMGILGP